MNTTYVAGHLIELDDADYAILFGGPPVVTADPRAAFIPVAMLRQRIDKLGMWEGFASYLVLNPTEMLRVLTTEGGMVDPADAAIGVAFDQLAVPSAARAYILAPRSAGVPDV